MLRPVAYRLDHCRCFASKIKPVTKLEARMKKKVNCAVYGCGLSASGALAKPSLVVNNKIVTAREVRKPIRISFCNLRDIKRIASGFGYSLFASNEALYGSGLNNNFQITSQRITDTKGQDYYISGKRIALPEQSKILSVSAGRAHSAVATSTRVYLFGSNVHGQCAVNPETSEFIFGEVDVPLLPVSLPTDSHIVKVHCTLDTTFVLTKAGEIFSFGLNEDGQCANGEYGIQWEPKPIIGDAAGEKIVDITGSTDTAVALNDKGDLFVWGQNEYGQALEGEPMIQLNVSRRLPISIGKVVSASSTASSCVAVTDQGVVYVWGVGFLGMGPSIKRLSRPTAMDQPLFNGKKVLRVFGGNTCAGALNEEGELFIWGQNRFGQLGLDHDKDQNFPLQVLLPAPVKDVALGTDHSLFLTK